MQIASAPFDEAVEEWGEAALRARVVGTYILFTEALHNKHHNILSVCSGAAVVFYRGVYGIGLALCKISLYGKGLAAGCPYDAERCVEYECCFTGCRDIGIGIAQGNGAHAFAHTAAYADYHQRYNKHKQCSVLYVVFGESVLFQLFCGRCVELVYGKNEKYANCKQPQVAHDLNADDFANVAVVAELVEDVPCSSSSGITYIYAVAQAGNDSCCIGQYKGPLCHALHCFSLLVMQGE